MTNNLALEILLSAGKEKHRISGAVKLNQAHKNVKTEKNT